MSIKLKDTIYDLINNADKLDGSHLTDIIRYYTPSSSNVLNLDDLKSTTGFQVTGWAYAGSPYVNSQPDGDGASSAATVIKFPGNYPFQIYRFYSNNNIKIRGYYSGTGWTSWATILTSDNYTTYCASASHSHNYASTVKIGSTSYTCSSNVISLPAYPTSLKCPKSLTIQLNGTSQGAWDGSADKTINITPASISAAASSHTHNYAGSSSAGGAATSANKLNTTSFSASTDINFNYTFWTASGACSDISSMGYAAVMNVGSDLYRGWQIWNSRNDHKLYWRPAISDASAWKSTPHIILDSNNWSSYCAAASHTHSYASKVTVGSTAYNVSSNNITIPAYPTSLKCPTALTIQLNGTSQGAWDGSAAKTINITYSSVGAAAASHTHSYAATNHTHNYAGSSSAGGNANYLASHDTRSVTIAPNAFGAHLSCHFKQNNTNGVNDGGSYFGLIYFRPYGSSTDFSGGYPHELAFTENSNIWYRKATSSTAWGSWQKILTSSNWSSYCAAASHTHSGYASSSHTHNYAGSDTAGGGANSVRSTGFGNGNFTWYQSNSSFFGSNWTNGWASYLISNYGNGSNYYNYTIALPFWTYPYYKRMTGSTSSTAGWYYFVTQENIGSMSVNYATSAGNADTVDSHHFSTVSALPSSPNANTVYFIV